MSEQRLDRRAFLVGSAGLSISVACAKGTEGGGNEVEELIARAERKNAAFIRGDMAEWSRLVRIAPDFTLMQPFGGPTSFGFDSSARHLAELSRFFKNGEATLEVS